MLITAGMLGTPFGKVFLDPLLPADVSPIVSVMRSAVESE
jgi:hypothetical protein